MKRLMVWLAPLFLWVAMAPAQAEGMSEVARAVFTTGIDNREPVDQVSQLPGTANQIYFFTELRNMEGQSITHRWEYGGEVMAEIGFDIGGPRWRIWSSKTLMPAWGGEWTVSVVSSSGEVIASESFTYGGE